ncbi:conserved hypothetical protein [Halomonas sp. 59]|nr:conserved hypothetical protein [Halomonas sp. 59]CAD5252214.1 conserved hypothetical protein [Halomonas sp. 156]
MKGKLNGGVEKGNFDGYFEITSTIDDILPSGIDKSSSKLVGTAVKWFGIDSSAVLKYKLMSLNGDVQLGLANRSFSANLEAALLNDIIKGELAFSQYWDAQALEYFSQPTMGPISAGPEYKGILTLDASGKLGLNIPKTIPLVGGVDLKGNARFHYTQDGDYSNDYVAAWGKFEVGWKWATYTYQNGFQFSFDGEFTKLGDKEIELIGSWMLEPEMGVVILSASWEPEVDDAQLVVITPEGDRIKEQDFDKYDNIVLVDDLNGTGSRHVALHEPRSGIWDIEVISASDLGEVDYYASDMLTPPELTIGAVTFDLASDTVDVALDVTLNDETAANVNFFATPDGESETRLPLEAIEAINEGKSSYTFSTAHLPPGSYTLGAELVGESTAPVLAVDNTPLQITGVADISLSHSVGAPDANGMRMVDITMLNEGDRASGANLLEIDVPADFPQVSVGSGGLLLEEGENALALPSLAPGQQHVVKMQVGQVADAGSLRLTASPVGYEEVWGNNQLVLSMEQSDETTPQPQPQPQPEPVPVPQPVEPQPEPTPELAPEPQPAPQPTPIPTALASFVDVLTEKGWEWTSELTEALSEEDSFKRYSELNESLNPIIRLYTGILDRAADREGLEYWVSQLNAGSSLNDIERAFMSAEEVSAAVQAMGSDDAAFVDTLYQSVLGRAADESGREYWLDNLQSDSVKRADIALSFVNSDEYIDTSAPFVTATKLLTWGVNLEQMDMLSLGFGDELGFAEPLVRLHTGLMGEVPDEAVFSEWLEDNQSPEALAERLLESEGLLTDEEGLIDTLYTRVLDRAPDVEGEQYWQAIIESGDASLTDMVLAFTESDEHQQRSRSDVDDYVEDAIRSNLVGVETDLETYLFA